MSPRRRRWFQLGLRTLLLLATAIGAWTAHFNSQRQIEPLEARIASMRKFGANELIVEDDSKIAAVLAQVYWDDETRWELYMPPGEYRVCLATREIAAEGLAPIATSAVVEGGRHTLEFRQDWHLGGQRLFVVWDGQRLLTADEDDAWDDDAGMTTLGPQFEKCTHFAADEAVVLIRGRYIPRETQREPGPWNDQVLTKFPTIPTPPPDPVNGKLLWIQRVGAE